MVTLGKGAYEQMLLDKAAVEALVIYQLSRIKNQLLARFICESDKVELYLGLIKGVQTQPIMELLDTIYQTFVFYANSIVDLKKERPDLLQLDNASFLVLRIQNLIMHRGDCEQHIVRAKEALCHLTQIEKGSEEDEEEHFEVLITHYNDIKVFLLQYNPRTCALIEQLQKRESELEAVKHKIADINKAKGETDKLKLEFKSKEFDLDERAPLEVEAAKLRAGRRAKLEAKLNKLIAELTPLNAEHGKLKAECSKLIAELRLVNVKNLCEKLRTICEKEITTFETYKLMADNYLLILPRQVKGKLYKLELGSAHSSLIINEPGWIKGTPFPERMNFNEGVCTKHQYIDLSVDILTDRARLYHYHQIRGQTLLYIRDELKAFQIQLQEPGWTTNSKKCMAVIERYRVIQPYFCDAISDRHKDGILVHYLDELSQQEITAADFVDRIEELEAPLRQVEEILENEIQRSKSRQLLFRDAYVETKTEKKALSLDDELVKRQGKWIRHQRLSDASGGMKTVLKNLLKFSDPVLGLTKIEEFDPEKVPFPEMKNDLVALATPMQISWVKRMINLTHFMDTNFRYLESLDREISNDDKTQMVVDKEILQSIKQLQPFIDITDAYQTLIELMQEPIAQELWYTFKEYYDDFMAVFAELKPLYFLGSEEVEVADPAPIENAGLWYPLLDVMVFPTHIKAVAKGEDYGSSQAKSVQQKAKEMAQEFQSLINQFQCGRYFRLLWKSPYILVKLLPELRSIVDKFRYDTHKATMENLVHIQTKLQSILLETDALELKLGLQIGMLSKPMKIILDKLWLSFILPLNLKLEVMAPLIKNQNSFEQRTKVIVENKESLDKMQASETQTFKSVTLFLERLKEINTRLTSKKEITPEEKKSFTDMYWNLYPLLQSQQSRFEISMNQSDKSIELDRFCEECLNGRKAGEGQVHHYPHLTDVMYLVKRVSAFKEGHVKTLDMKGKYLQSQHKEIRKAQRNYTFKTKEMMVVCIQDVIEKQIDQICQSANQEIYLSTNDKTKLRVFLKDSEKSILEFVLTKSTKDLDQIIKQQLQVRLEKYYKTDYMQLKHLEAILTEISAFQAYCKEELKAPIYENTNPMLGTLGPKITLLEKLKKIAEDTSVSPAERIEAIKKEADQPSFGTTLQSYENYFGFDFKSLKRCIWRLIHSIYYLFSGKPLHPEYVYHSLAVAINVNATEPPLVKQLLSQLGLFSQEAKLNDTPVLNPGGLNPLAN